MFSYCAVNLENEVDCELYKQTSFFTKLQLNDSISISFYNSINFSEPKDRVRFKLSPYLYGIKSDEAFLGFSISEKNESITFEKYLDHRIGNIKSVDHSGEFSQIDSTNVNGNKYYFFYVLHKDTNNIISRKRLQYFRKINKNNILKIEFLFNNYDLDQDSDLKKVINELLCSLEIKNEAHR